MIKNDHIGDVWPPAQPSKNSALYGKAELAPEGAFEVRSLQTFTLVYTAGPRGIDDTGGIRVLFRFTTDWGRLQTDDPNAENYVSAVAGNGVDLAVSYQDGILPRPWYHGLNIDLVNGYLGDGDTITITFGDTAAGSPGLRLQSFCESHFEFKIAVDIFATGQYVPLKQRPNIRIVPSASYLWKAITPTFCNPGKEFWLGVKSEDIWGNPSDQAEETLFLTANLAVDGLPDRIDYIKGQRAVRLKNLIVHEEGILRIRILNRQREILAEANPMVIKNDSLCSYWGDLHGQSGESVGIGSAQEYFEFARDLSFLDVSSHQANDFQLNNTFWQHLNKLTAAYNQDGMFVIFPGYEWSGNTCVGGDRNVYFSSENRQIRRSSHALLSDQSDIDTDSPTARDLFRDLAEEDCVVFAHCGGRYANIDYAHDPELETSMELHSAWGTFEWLLEDCFKKGYRCGVVCNSDGHKGRPGSVYPGAANFAAYGGLTCFLATDLSRGALFDSIRKRHTYGTTGCRLHLKVNAKFTTSGRLFDRDPQYFDTSFQEVPEAMMGDIVQTDDTTVELCVSAISRSPIDRIDVLNGGEVIKTLRGYTAEDLGSRIRIVWSGSEYRGRGNQTHWQGTAQFNHCSIQSLTEINNWNPEKRYKIQKKRLVSWESLTAGNFCGFEVWLDNLASGRLDLVTNLVSTQCDLNRIGIEGVILKAGGLKRQIRIDRLPDRNNCLEISETIKISLRQIGDNPLWVRVTTEDGHQAWSSPIYLFTAKPYTLEKSLNNPG